MISTKNDKFLHNNYSLFVFYEKLLSDIIIILTNVFVKLPVFSPYNTIKILKIVHKIKNFTNFIFSFPIAPGWVLL